MSSDARNNLIFLGKAILASVPWLLSMYALYYLQYGEVWSLDTPHRGKSSVAILIAGMGLSFLLYTLLFDRKK